MKNRDTQTHTHTGVVTMFWQIDRQTDRLSELNTWLVMQLKLSKPCSLVEVVDQHDFIESGNFHIQPLPPLYFWFCLLVRGTYPVYFSSTKWWIDWACILLSSTVMVPQSSLYQNKHHHHKQQAQNKTHIINQQLSREEAPPNGSPITHHSLLHICISLKHSVSFCVHLFRSCVHLLNKICSVLMVWKKGGKLVGGIYWGGMNE